MCVVWLVSKSLTCSCFILCLQFSNWVDAVVFVFSLENEDSFQEVLKYYTLLANYRNTSDIAVMLVGTQGEPCGLIMTSC